MIDCPDLDASLSTRRPSPPRPSSLLASSTPVIRAEPPNLLLDDPCSELPEVDIFWDLADQWEWIQERPALEHEIIGAARRLLAQPI